MDKLKLEQLTSSIAVTFLSLLTVGGIILLADTIFGWDIFPPDIEKALSFIMLSLGFIIFSSVIVNIMLNVSLIASTLREFTDHKHGK
jgi:hypothetical protein